jgi:dihydropteroate synthase
MAIINLTPDSFSGDGRLGRPAIAYAAVQVKDGADIIDIGAESTRPGATPLSATEEWARLEPFLAEAANEPWRQHIRLSVDTRRGETARRAVEAGADIINDVSGFADPEMLGALREYDCDMIVMHALSVPADPTVVWPDSIGPIEEILRWKEAMIAKAAQNEIAAERLIFDPGIGFGKTPAQSLALILGAKQLVESGGRWVFGHSRKSYLKLFDAEALADERDALTLAFSAVLAEADVPYLRVHDIPGHQAMFAKLCI